MKGSLLEIERLVERGLGRGSEREADRCAELIRQAAVSLPRKLTTAAVRRCFSAAGQPAVNNVCAVVCRDHAPLCSCWSVIFTLI